MNWSMDEAGKITTSFVLLDSEVIELCFSGGIVSDQGRTFETVRLQTAHAPFPAAWRQQQAIEASRAAGVQYQHGVFWQAVSGLTLDEAITRLLNAILLSAGSMIGTSLWTTDTGVFPRLFLQEVLMKQFRAQLQVMGASDLSTVDLLALTLSQKTDPQLVLRLTHLLQEYPVQRLRQASLAELRQAGLTPLQAERLVAICELTRRLAVLETNLSPRIQQPGDAVAILRPFMCHLDQETLRVLVLSNKNQVMANLELYRGTIDQTEFRIAEILRPALVRNAPALLVAHFHPSGDPTPSPSDQRMTGQLLEAAKLRDIEITDHLILGNPRYVSLRSLMKW